MQVSTQCVFATLCRVSPGIKAKGASKVLQSHMQASKHVFGAVVFTSLTQKQQQRASQVSHDSLQVQDR